MVVLCAALISGCATAPDKVAATYVSPAQYGAYDCDQLRAELFRVSDHVRETAGVQQRARTRDDVAMGVGLVVFWPALFFLMGGDKKEELATLKGQYEALDEVAVQKKCAVADEIQLAKEQEAATKHKKARKSDSTTAAAMVAVSAPSKVASPPAKPTVASTAVAPAIEPIASAPSK